MDSFHRRSLNRARQPAALRQRSCLGLLALAALAVAAPAPAGAAQSRIISGSPVSAAEVSPQGRWSAVVAVFATDARGTRLCTGTLIAADWVLTAGHCLAEPSDATKALPPTGILVAGGVTSTATAGDALIGAAVTAVHPQFSWTGGAWDAGLIQLKTSAPVAPYGLPNPARPGDYAAGTTDNIAGFGRSRSADPATSGYLRTGRLEAVSPALCAVYNPDSVPYADCYEPGPAAQATCFGDSGGPVLRFDSTMGGAPVVWGVTSTGPDPCEAGFTSFAPTFATRVNSILSWITATRNDSTYVPAPAATHVADRDAAVAGAGSRASRTPLGGTGVGVFSTKLSGPLSHRRARAVTLKSSFVGTAGTGLVTITGCVRAKRCQTLSRKTIKFATASVTITSRVPIPKCKRKAETLTLLLAMKDPAGKQRDLVSKRLGTCK